jgi:hypothetical protein
MNGKLFFFSFVVSNLLVSVSQLLKSHFFFFKKVKFGPVYSSNKKIKSAFLYS